MDQADRGTRAGQDETIKTKLESLADGGLLQFLVIMFVAAAMFLVGFSAGQTIPRSCSDSMIKIIGGADL